MKHATHRVTAQGDQGETGDIGVKGDQVRDISITFPAGICNNVALQLKKKKKNSFLCFQGPPGVPGIKGEVLQNTISKEFTHNQSKRGEMV